MRTLSNNFFPESVCKQHGIIDVFPCPWPGCPNGIAENCFQVESFSDGEHSNIYRRHCWKSPIEGKYYNWELEGHPHWFSAAKTFWNEARRLNLVSRMDSRVIYHYTNVEALVGIIESQAIWLSDYSYLNDKRELTHGVEIVTNVAEQMASTEQSPNTQTLLNHWIEVASNGNPRVCIASFSGNSDSLSQWRAYGSLAIGFKPQSIAIHANQARLNAVEYNVEIQKKLVQVYLSHLVQAYEADLVNNSLERIPDVYHRFEQLIELVAFFKDASFASEQEFRLAYVEHPELFERDYLNPPPKRFRVKGGRILPYIVSSELFPMPNEEKRDLGICEIVLGPESDDLLASGVREFLDANSLQDVPILRSKVPYRT